MKLLLHLGTHVSQNVAPLAGAWIETGQELKQQKNIIVAPLAGAWIETLLAGSQGSCYGGRPPCGGVD